VRLVPFLVVLVFVFGAIFATRWMMRREERADCQVCQTPGLSVLDSDGVDLCDSHRRRYRKLQFLEWQLFSDKEEDE